MQHSKLFSIAAASLLLTSCSSSPNIENPEIQNTALQDGTYSQHQEYSPNEEYTFFIDVQTEIQNGTIASMNVEGDPNGQMTLMFAEEFKNAFQDKVIGKTLKEAKDMIYVSGASLTSNAFNEALDAIADQASQK